LELAPSPETRALIETIRARQGQRSPLAELLPRPNGGSKPAVEPSADETRLGASDTINGSTAPRRPRRPTGRWVFVATIPAVVLTCTTVTLRQRARIDSDRIDVVTFENR